MGDRTWGAQAPAFVGSWTTGLFLPHSGAADVAVLGEEIKDESLEESATDPTPCPRREAGMPSGGYAAEAFRLCRAGEGDSG